MEFDTHEILPTPSWDGGASTQACALTDIALAGMEPDPPKPQSVRDHKHRALSKRRPLPGRSSSISTIAINTKHAARDGTHHAKTPIRTRPQTPSLNKAAPPRKVEFHLDHSHQYKARWPGWNPTLHNPTIRTRPQTPSSIKAAPPTGRSSSISTIAINTKHAARDGTHHAKTPIRTRSQTPSSSKAAPPSPEGRVPSRP